MDHFEVFPIGYVRRRDGGVFIDILEAYRPALHLLGHFSHVMVLWWATLNDAPEARQHTLSRPPYALDRPTGVFACRSSRRPNPILLTTCRILRVDEEAGVVQVGNIDAFDGSPVIDLKAYFPASDRVKDAHLPEWLVDWPEWQPEEGQGL
jgi:tRNA-Thr(GGU) m(6)t(6)A37 methyltransferase TsaA